MQRKIKTLLIQLNHGLVERENTFESGAAHRAGGRKPAADRPARHRQSLIARRIADCLSTRPDMTIPMPIILNI